MELYTDPDDFRIIDSLDEEIKSLSHLVDDIVIEEIDAAKIPKTEATSTSKHPEPSRTPSAHISIRIPNLVLLELRREARRRGIPYQTLANLILSDAALVWQRAHPQENL